MFGLEWVFYRISRILGTLCFLQWYTTYFTGMCYNYYSINFNTYVAVLNKVDIMYRLIEYSEHIAWELHTLLPISNNFFFRSRN